MKRAIFSLITVLTLSVGLNAHAITVAHWRFEAGPANTPVAHSTAPGVFDGTIPDVSGNGNTLSVWEVGGAGYAYRSDVPQSQVPGLGNAANNFSVKNTGGGPAMFTTSSAALPTGVDIETMTPTAFTIEASWKPENGGFRTVVGRDAQNVSTGNGAVAALYFQARPDNSVGIAFTDLAGNTHEAFSPAGLIQGFDFPTDNEGVNGNWYNLVGVSDGSTLKMYVNNALVASTPFTTPDAGLAIGTTNGGDWHAGEWSVGRGLFNGGHTDRAYGFIDEVRISNSALTPTQFLVPSALSIQVNTTTGAVTLKNDAATAVNVDFYRIASNAGAMSFANWSSLDDQNFSAIDLAADGDAIAGNSPGEGWDEAGGSGVNQLVEQFLRSSGSSIAANQTLNLGNAFNTGAFGSGVDGDLAFTYSYNGGAPLTGTVTYVGGGLPGDFNHDGKVNGGDFLLWQRDMTVGSLATWRPNFGAQAVAAASAVPEPTTLGLLLVAGAIAGVRRRVR